MAERRIVAITGANGFIGRHLANALSKTGFEIVAIARDCGHDLCDRQSLADIPRFDVLVHLAAKSFVPTSFDQPCGVLYDNYVSTLNVLDLCRKYESPMVFASSYIYGPPQKLPVDESHPVSHWNPYASSKLLCEQLCTSYSMNFDLDIRVLRLFNIFGHGQSDTFLIPTIIKGLRKGDLQLQNSVPKRDFLHVSDLVDAITLCLGDSWSGLETYNIGSGTSHSVAEIVDMAKEIGGMQDVPVTYSNKVRKAEVLDVVADCSKIDDTLGWTPKLSFRDGMRLTMENEA